MDLNTSTASQADQTRAAKPHAATRWRKLVEDQRASGLPVSAFCRQRGIAASSLFAWRRRLTRGGDGAAPFAGQEVFKPVTVVTRRKPRGRGGDDADAAAAAIGLPAASFIELCLPGGRRLIVRRGFDRQLLLDVVNALESPS